MSNANSISVRDASGQMQSVSTMDALLAKTKLIAKPFRSGLYTPTVVNATLGSTPTNRQAGNDDGTGVGIQVSVTANAALGNYAMLRHFFRGNSYAPRFQRDATYGGRTFGLTIDGITKAIDASILVDVETNAASSAVAGISADTPNLFTDLGDGLHEAVYTFPCLASGGPSLWFLHGYLVEDVVGEGPPVRGVNFATTPVSLTAASWTSLPASSYGTQGCRGVIFTNNTGSAAVVDVRYTSGAGIIWTQSLADKSSVIFDPLGIVSHGFDVRSSVSAVTAGWIGGN